MLVDAQLGISIILVGINAVLVTRTFGVLNRRVDQLQDAVLASVKAICLDEPHRLPERVDI